MALISIENYKEPISCFPAPFKSSASLINSIYFKLKNVSSHLRKNIGRDVHLRHLLHTSLIVIV